MNLQDFKDLIIFVLIILYIYTRKQYEREKTAHKKNIMEKNIVIEQIRTTFFNQKHKLAKYKLY